MKKCSRVIAIGPYNLSGRVLLAPMAGVTDLPFRQICQGYGAGLTTSEMVTAKVDHWDTDKSRLRFVPVADSSIPHSVQIVGGDALQMAEAAQMAVAMKADIVDINMGCPAKKVCRKAAGSALLKDELLVAQILSAVVASVPDSVPVTLKIRTGWDTSHKNAVNIARIAQDQGIKALAVHGRTRACRFVGEVEFDTVAEVKQSVSIPVIANGDIDHVDKALAVLQKTDADALMIGRGAQGQPWLIAQINALLNEEPWQEPSFSEKQQVILQHLRAIHSFYGDFKGLRLARKHIAAYLERLNFPVTVKKEFNRIDSVSQQLRFIGQLH